MEHSNQYATGVPNMDQQVAIEDDLDSLSIDPSDPSILVDDELSSTKKISSHSSERNRQCICQDRKGSPSYKGGAVYTQIQHRRAAAVINILKGDMSIVGIGRCPCMRRSCHERQQVERFIAPAGLTDCGRSRKGVMPCCLPKSARSGYLLCTALFALVGYQDIFRTFTAFIQKEMYSHPKIPTR